MASSTAEFFNSDSPIAKVAFLLLVIIVFVFALRLGTQLLAYLLKPTGSPILINGMIDGDQYMVIEQDPANKKSIPILRSNNENEGIEFTWSVWLMIEDYQADKNKYKHIFHKGNDQISKIEIQIYDHLGRIIKTGLISENQNKIRISLQGLSTGTYIVKCFNRSFEKHFKLIKL